MAGFQELAGTGPEVVCSKAVTGEAERGGGPSSTACCSPPPSQAVASIASMQCGMVCGSGSGCQGGGERVRGGWGRLVAAKPGCWQGWRVRPVKPLPGTTVAPLACTGPSSHLTSPARSTLQTSDHTRPPSNLPQQSLANLPIYPVNQVIKFFVLLCTISNQ